MSNERIKHLLEDIYHAEGDREKKNKLKVGSLWKLKPEGVSRLLGVKIKKPVFAVLIGKNHLEDSCNFIFLGTDIGYFPYINLNKCNLSKKPPHLETRKFKIISALDTNLTPRKHFSLNKNDIEKLMEPHGLCDTPTLAEEKKIWQKKAFMKF